MLLVGALHLSGPGPLSPTLLSRFFFQTSGPPWVTGIKGWWKENRKLLTLVASGPGEETWPAGWRQKIAGTVWGGREPSGEATAGAGATPWPLWSQQDSGDSTQPALSSHLLLGVAQTGGGGSRMLQTIGPGSPPLSCPKCQVGVLAPKTWTPTRDGPQSVWVGSPMEERQPG